MVKSTLSSSATISPPRPEPASASTSTEEAADVQVNPQAPPQRARRRILASAVIAAVAVIGLLGTITIRDRDSGRSEAPSGSPAASAQARDLTPAELNEMWAAADAAFAGLEPPAAVVRVPAHPTAEPDAALWASVDYMTITGGR
jgi:hypothetical protein